MFNYVLVRLQVKRLLYRHINLQKKNIGLYMYSKLTWYSFKQFIKTIKVHQDIESYFGAV